MKKEWKLSSCQIVKKILIPCFLFIIFLFANSLYAATSISVSNANPKPGDKVSATVTVSGVATWNVEVSVKGPATGNKILLTGFSDDGNVTTATKTQTFTVTGEGNITFATTSSSNGVANGQYVKMDASKTIVSKIPAPPAPPAPLPPAPPAEPAKKVIEKSGNNNLKSLRLNYEGMSPVFSASKTRYAITVGKDVNSLIVTALPQDSTAKVYVSGNTKFKDGDNIVYITVTAQNGAKKTYTITVTKAADEQKANAYLESLIIENAKLTPEFQREILEYDCGSVASDVDRLTILTFPENKQATFEISGNDLVVGENKITIKVKAVDGVTIKEYILKVVKEDKVLSQTNAMVTIYDDTPSEIQKVDNPIVGFFKKLWKSIKSNSLLVLMYLMIIVEFIQIVYLYKKVNKYEENTTTKKENMIGVNYIEKDIKQSNIKEDSSALQILNDEEPKKRNALGQNGIKDLTEEKKELEDKNNIADHKDE
ncbi:MAG: cadherin-like beta sandwich domain-containing protein [Clostridia bacterium]